jgi:hypothetical protein
MLKVTGGRWPRNVPIPWAAGEDIFTSRLAREMKIFPYGRNIAVVVSAVMDKDRQDTARKRRAFTRVGDPSREVKRVRGGAKSTAPGSSKPPPATKPAVFRPSKSSAGARVVASAGKPPSAEPTKERRPPSPVRTYEATAGGADFDTDICVEDYLVGEFFLGLGLEQGYGAGSDVGQLAVVPAPVAATSPTAVVGAKGTSQDPWSKFCASGEISSVAAAKDVAASVPAAETCVAAVETCKSSWTSLVRCFYVVVNLMDFSWQAAACADPVASGALTSELAAERQRLEGRIERLRAQHTDAVRDKSAAENKSHRLTDRLAVAEAEKEDLRRQLAEERRDANRACAEAQAAPAEAKLARAGADGQEQQKPSIYTVFRHHPSLPVLSTRTRKISNLANLHTRRRLRCGHI